MVSKMLNTRIVSERAKHSNTSHEFSGSNPVIRRLAQTQALFRRPYRTRSVFYVIAGTEVPAYSQTSLRDEHFATDQVFRIKLTITETTEHTEKIYGGEMDQISFRCTGVEIRVFNLLLRATKRKSRSQRQALERACGKARVRRVTVLRRRSVAIWRLISAV